MSDNIDNKYGALINEFQNIVNTLEGIAPSPDSIDANLDSNSQKPVQNKTIKAAIDTINTTLSNKADKSQVDSLVIPTVPEISTNIENDKNNDSKTASPKAVRTYVNAQVAGATGVSVDNALDLTSTNPVENKAIKAAIDDINTTLGTKADKSQITNLARVASSGEYSDLKNPPRIPTVPIISQNITEDAGQQGKTVSPPAVVDYVGDIITAQNDNLFYKVGDTFTIGANCCLSGILTRLDAIDTIVLSLQTPKSMKERVPVLEFLHGVILADKFYVGPYIGTTYLDTYKLASGNSYRNGFAWEAMGSFCPVTLSRINDHLLNIYIQPGSAATQPRFIYLNSPNSSDPANSMIPVETPITFLSKPDLEGLYEDDGDTIKIEFV